MECTLYTDAGPPTPCDGVSEAWIAYAVTCTPSPLCIATDSGWTSKQCAGSWFDNGTETVSVCVASSTSASAAGSAPTATSQAATSITDQPASVPVASNSPGAFVVDPRSPLSMQGLLNSVVASTANTTNSTSIGTPKTYMHVATFSNPNCTGYPITAQLVVDNTCLPTLIHTFNNVTKSSNVTEKPGSFSIFSRDFANNIYEDFYIDSDCITTVPAEMTTALGSGRCGPGNRIATVINAGGIYASVDYNSASCTASPARIQFGSNSAGPCAVSSPCSVTSGAHRRDGTSSITSNLQSCLKDGAVPTLVQTAHDTFSDSTPYMMSVVYAADDCAGGIVGAEAVALNTCYPGFDAETPYSGRVDYISSNSSFVSRQYAGLGCTGEPLYSYSFSNGTCDGFASAAVYGNIALLANAQKPSGAHVMNSRAFAAILMFLWTWFGLLPN
ncbi:hypothetical protein BC830DRAFT_1171435 [Chytriomyces sp. MP71]|nr:hypothetical protein BC830DRAFT_1171435 [Chytriomyces sp. MP71]